MQPLHHFWDLGWNIGGGGLLPHLFWLSTFLIVYVYFGYPLVLLVLGLFLKKPWQKAEVFPTVSLIVAAYNEEAVIQAKLQNCFQLNYPSELLEIVVASESTDGTNAIVRSFHPRVKLMTFERCGKASMLFRAVPQLQGEVIVFSDANAFYETDAIQMLVQNFVDRRIGCVSGRLTYINSEGTAAKGESAFWRYECWLKRLESNIQSLLGANGSIFALRKDLYLPLSESRGDDFELAAQVLVAGRGVIFEERAISREAPSVNVNSEFHRRVRNMAVFLGPALALFSQALRRGRFLMAFELFSHKLLRWLLAPFLLLSLVSNGLLVRTHLAPAFWLQSLFYLFAIVGWMWDRKRARVPSLLRLPYYFCTLHLAVFWGLLAQSGQKTYWEKNR